MEKNVVRTLTSKVVMVSAGVIAVASFILGIAGLLSIAQKANEIFDQPVTHPFELSSIALLVASIIFGLLILLERSKRRELYRLTHDNTTNLPWRSQIPEEAPKGSTVYLYIVLKEYTQYIERFGLSVVDPYVKAISLQIQNIMGKSHYELYRYSDSDLLIIYYGTENLSTLCEKAQSVVSNISEKTYEIYSPDDVQGSFILSVGICPTSYSSSSDTLLTYSKFAALEAAKIEGPAAVNFDLSKFLKHKEIIDRRHHLQEVIENAQIATVFQPIISCKTGELYGYEALSRPTNPAFANVGELLDDAEVLGLYSKLELVLTLSAITAFRDFGATNTRLFINMAPETIRRRIYDDPIKQGYFDNIKFVIEIIERGEVFADIITILNKSIAKLNAMIALDDFGTGYSNHLALLNSKPDIVKVSRELIQGINLDMDKQRTYENIVTFARSLGTSVLAEGVENKEEFEYLLRLGMDLAQGYYIGRPTASLMPVPEEITLLVAQYQDFTEKLLSQQQMILYSGRNPVY